MKIIFSKLQISGYECQILWIIFEQFYAKDRREWRQWLREHHNSSPGVWLIYYKKNSDKRGLSMKKQ